jgi:hypothetical protein
MLCYYYSMQVMQALMIRLALSSLNLLLHYQLYESYKDVQFSKKHQGDYLKYTPDAIDGGIEELFQG